MGRHSIVVLDDWTCFWEGQPALARLRERGTAGLGLGLMLALGRQLTANDRRVRSGDWASPPGVYDAEPLPVDHPFTRLDNVV